MVLLKKNFTLQQRVRLAQGLWLLSWVAVMSGTFVFCLGVYLKTELVRRAEVEREREKHSHTHKQTNECNVTIKTGGPSLKTLFVCSDFCLCSWLFTEFALPPVAYQ